LAEKLRAGAKVQILLKEPEPPLLNVGIAGGATRGRCERRGHHYRVYRFQLLGLWRDVSIVEGIA